MNYLMHNDAPIFGPAHGLEIVDMILALGAIQAQYAYSNASRYQLAKEGRYPNNKAGEARLQADILNNADKLAAYRKIVRPYRVECYFPLDSVPIYTETIRAADEQLAIEKMQGIMRWRVSRDDLPTMRYFATLQL